MPFSPDIPEEQLKNEVAETIFYAYDCTRIIGKIDFAVGPHTKRDQQEQGAEDLLPLGPPSFLWAEAKKGRANLTHALIQLVLTIGRARTFNRHDPPKYLAAFDAHGITLIPFGEVYPIYQLNDFNWNATASDHHTEEFHQLEELLGDTLAAHRMSFQWEDGGLKTFIRQNFTYGGPTVRLAIDRHNFITVYSRWREVVMPTIGVQWDEVKAYGIIDADFYLADLLSQENRSILEKLNVLLLDDRHRLSEGRAKTGGRLFSEVLFGDGGQQHRAFWNAYQRPPDAVYWDYIMERRDLLVPGDVREVKGAFFTPELWVRLSQQHLAEHLGPSWQDEYYVWDCAAGTGNLLAGLTNPRRVWASTLDQADVDVMHQLIAKNSRVADAPPQLFTNHVFQFDFLNDSWEKLPEELRAIVEDPEKRKRLVVYINPPYAEAGNARQTSGLGRNKAGVATAHSTAERYRAQLGPARNEVYALFLARIATELRGCTIGAFCTLKIMQGSNFSKFRQFFTPRLERLFLCPSMSFDNVKGEFPIGFFIWDSKRLGAMDVMDAQVYDAEGASCGRKRVQAVNPSRTISRWLAQYRNGQAGEPLGMMNTGRTDFQNQRLINIQYELSSARTHAQLHRFYADNLIPGVVFYAVRQCIQISWLNNQDQFYWPRDEWMDDPLFHSDCLVYSIFHRKNRISHADGPNHWIPYTEEELGLTQAFASSLLSDFIRGRLPAPEGARMPEGLGLAPVASHQVGKPAFATGQTPLEFSEEAGALLEAGRRMWRYYLSKPGVDINASFYDIRAYFQGRRANGAVRARSDDAEYTALYAAIQDARKHLGDVRIAPRVYEYGFLLG